MFPEENKDVILEMLYEDKEELEYFIQYFYDNIELCSSKFSATIKAIREIENDINA